MHATTPQRPAGAAGATPAHAESSYVEALRLRFDSLTPRQKEVCLLMVQGELSKHIAERLGTSINTIKTHRAEIFRKMAAGSLLDLARMMGLIGPALADGLPLQGGLPAALVTAPATDAAPAYVPPAVAPGSVTGPAWPDARPPEAGMPASGNEAARVLVVEDNRDLSEAMVRALEMMGYHATSIRHGDHLETVLLGHPADIVLLDIGLGDEHADGFALAARARTCGACGIVMLTARGEREARIRGLESGADAYLVKPVDFDELDAVIRSLMRRLPGRALRPA